jgi:hypothetical protein
MPNVSFGRDCTSIPVSIGDRVVDIVGERAVSAVAFCRYRRFC